MIIGARVSAAKTTRGHVESDARLFNGFPVKKLDRNPPASARVEINLTGEGGWTRRWDQAVEQPDGTRTLHRVTAHLRNGRGAYVERWKPPPDPLKPGVEPDWQYSYDVDVLAANQGIKFAKNRQLAGNMERVREQVANDLDTPGKRGVTALAVALMDQAYFRVGNEGSAADGHFGLTTLQKQHLSFGVDDLGNPTATFDFIGKSGVHQVHTLAFDDEMMGFLRRLHRQPGAPEEKLFRYDAGKGLTADDVNAYLKPFDLTAKDFRTYHATRLATDGLLEAQRAQWPRTEKERQDMEKRVIMGVAERLGHKWTECRDSYIDPWVLEQFREGRLR